MSRKFGEYLDEIQAEAQTEGDAAVAQLAAFDQRYRQAHEQMARGKRVIAKATLPKARRIAARAPRMTDGV